MTDRIQPSRLSKGVIVAALPRSGTLSIATALTEIGYRTYHSHTEPPSQWAKFREALMAHSPRIARSYGAEPKQPWTREQWDSAYGDYDAVTEILACFTVELARTYPDAKVVVVETDKQRWMDSTDEIYFRETLGSWWGTFVRVVVSPVAGDISEQVRWDIVRAFFRGDSIAEMRAAHSDVYDKFFRDVYANVAPERMLVFRHSDGWEPLCDFLGKEVPAIPYPHANERRVLLAKRKFLYKILLARFFRRLGFATATVSALGLGLWLAKRG
ncbi:hypothetical protein NKR23_g10301 [Pleurostoma richardsiae]|uniref:Sulfotransferase family protein n=1 Tax=Pleurostoma richardsiae TaxID=41990 RepID=A0AA38VBY2_9PEZI|nr:hypothetical protein NKR23_g10301 [Pleurostoma richardsiae]